MNLTIDLPDDLATALEARARAQGISPSDVVCTGLRLLEDREREESARLEWLRAAAAEGFDEADRGEYTALRSDRDFEEFLKRVGEESAVESTRRDRA